MPADGERQGPRHLIHVGFPKAASTSLQAWFAARPDIVFAPNGVAGFAGAEAVARDVAQRPTSAALYVTSSEHLSVPRRNDTDAIDPPQDGTIDERRRRACQLLRDLFADPTILIVTRGFRSVVVSAYSQYVRSGGHLGLPAFMQMLVASGAETGTNIIDYYDYDATIATYEGTFGSERVIVLPYELLVEDPARFVATLEDRLALPHLGVDFARANAGLSDAELRWYPRFARVASWVDDRLGRPGRPTLARLFPTAGAPRARRLATRLARLIPEPGHSTGAEPGAAGSAGIVPEAILGRWAERTIRLRERAEYGPFREAYGPAVRVSG